MAQQLSPQIQAVLRILEQRMDQPPASFAQRFDAVNPSFDDRFRTFEGEAATVMPHEIGYGMSQRPYDAQMVDNIMAGKPAEANFPEDGGFRGMPTQTDVRPPTVGRPEPPPLDPEMFPGMEDFLSPGME